MKSSLWVLAFALLTACSSAKVEDYASHEPCMDIRTFLNGTIDAWGVFINRAGMADPSFHVTLKGKWDGDDGTLEEYFKYSDGRTDQRIWTIHFTDAHHFKATAHDVIGTGVGAQYGNASNLHYVLAVKDKGSTYNMSMDDWMYLMNDHTLINRTEMSKFGVKFGELVITFHKK